MDIKQGKELIAKRSNAFHDRYFKAYGQLILRIDNNTYLMSRENLMLKQISEDDIDMYDINTGDIGAIFRARKDINAIVFVCTEASAAFSKKNRELKAALDDLAQIVGPTVRVAPNSRSSKIIHALKGRLGCFVKGSGIIGVGRDLEEAIAAARILEKSAEVEIYGRKLGGIKYLSEAATQYLTDFYNKSYSKINREPYVNLLSYNEEEFRLRTKLIETGKKMCWDDLVQGTWGNLSVRLSDKEMLITPSGIDYFSIRIEDIVKVNINTLKYDKIQRKPSSELELHAGIYRTYPDAGAVIHTHSNGCSVFAAAHAGFKIGSPELKNVIGDLRASEYKPPGTKELTLSVMTALYGSHACIIANHGAIFYGNDLDVVLAIANAVEARACNLLGFGNILIGADKDDKDKAKGKK